MVWHVKWFLLNESTLEGDILVFHCVNFGLKKDASMLPGAFTEVHWSFQGPNFSPALAHDSPPVDNN